ncbi:MAG: TraR/DksA family transcriptional regulator [Anaerolineae bacterium]
MNKQTPNLHIVELEQQKRQTELDIRRFEAQLRVQVDPDLDEADPGLTAQTVTLALLNNARRKVEAIERALSQAKRGGYGICEACRRPIDPERLAVFPQATLCVPCKSKQERNGYARAA